jgi:ABC-type Zn uptake system ZnuABC Zn-binding protein ZnuA
MKRLVGLGRYLAAASVLAIVLVSVGCSARRGSQGAAEATRTASPIRVIAAEGFLADMIRQVGGERVEVKSLIPPGVEPHGYEPTPQDVAAVAGARLLVVNGAGLESFLSKLLNNAGRSSTVVEASTGIASRKAREGEAVESVSERPPTSAPVDMDPHFWLDPQRAVRYVENIRDALMAADPGGVKQYTAKAEAYIARLRELDRWIAAQVSEIPPADRMLVTNHESLGYFADRYGFRVIGTIIPSVSAEAAPTARQLARLVDALKSARARALFLETGASPALARQVAREAGVAVVTELYTHALSDASGPAPTYVAMMEYDAKTIVAALTGGAKGAGQ